MTTNRTTVINAGEVSDQVTVHSSSHPASVMPRECLCRLITLPLEVAKLELSDCQCHTAAVTFYLTLSPMGHCVPPLSTGPRASLPYKNWAGLPKGHELRATEGEAGAWPQSLLVCVHRNILSLTKYYSNWQQYFGKGIKIPAI